MVIRDHLPSPTAGYHSPYAAVAKWAADASKRALLELLIVPTTIALALVALATSFWPLAVLSGTPVCIGLWGLLAHREAAHPSVTVRVLKASLVLLGSLCALVGALAVFIGLLGPRWNL